MVARLTTTFVVKSGRKESGICIDIIKGSISEGQ
jgi:hypothetical protein